MKNNITNLVLSGADLNSLRLTLVQDATSFDYIKTKRPKAVLLETVPGIVRNKRLKKDIYSKWLCELLRSNHICTIGHQ